MPAAALTAAQAEALLSERPMHRRPLAERFLLADAFAGRRAVVRDDVHRDGTYVLELVGEVLGMARHRSGTTTSLVIVRTDDGKLEAVSSARVSSIELR